MLNSHVHLYCTSILLDKKSLIFIFFGFYLGLFIAFNSSTVAVRWKIFHFLAHKNKMYKKGPLQDKHLKVTKSILFLALYDWIVTQMMEDCSVICNTWLVFSGPFAPKGCFFQSRRQKHHMQVNQSPSHNVPILYLPNSPFSSRTPWMKYFCDSKSMISKMSLGNCVTQSEQHTYSELYFSENVKQAETFLLDILRWWRDGKSWNAV